MLDKHHEKCTACQDWYTATHMLVTWYRLSFMRPTVADWGGNSATVRPKLKDALTGKWCALTYLGRDVESYETKEEGACCSRGDSVSTLETSSSCAKGWTGHTAQFVLFIVLQDCFLQHQDPESYYVVIWTLYVPTSHGLSQPSS